MSADFAKAQRSAEKLVRSLAFDVPPINPVVVAKAVGVGVKFVTFRQDLQDKISGFFDSESNSIFVNESEHPNRQTFTIAHELGHKILHEDHIKSVEYKVLLRQSEMTGVKDCFEQEADAFAANLLVPRFFLEKYRKLASPQELAKLFVVSEPVIRNRLKFYRD